MPGKRDYSGLYNTTIGRLKVVDARINTAVNRDKITFLCTCGQKTRVPLKVVLSGNTRSCGCLGLETKQANGLKAGTHKGTETTEYNTWRGMRERCYLKTHKSYWRYGGRGIKVCRRWKRSFSDFLEDVGKKPTRRHSLDRINGNKGYSPKNCRWATPHIQRINRSFKHVGILRKTQWLGADQ